jgi:hypothetical protein
LDIPSPLGSVTEPALVAAVIESAFATERTSKSADTRNEASSQRAVIRLPTFAF